MFCAFLKMIFRILPLVGFAISFCITSAFSNDNSLQIRKAAYLFEMKGESKEAIKILESISQNGSLEERVEADFLLGKILELLGNKDNAIFFYNQNLLHTKSSAQAFFVSERLASLNPKPETMIQKKINLPAPVKQFFLDDSSHILLTNQKIFNPISKEQKALPSDIPTNAKILHISKSGIWWQAPTTLSFTPLVSTFSPISTSIQRPIDAFLYLSPYQIAYISNEQLVMLSGKAERFRTSKKYKDCSIQENLFSKETILLNCPDNAIHFISKESGEELGVISMLDPISKIHQDESGILLFSSDALWFFSPNDFNVPQWRLNSLSVEHIVSSGQNFAVLETSGRLLLIKKQNGEVILKKGTTGNFLMPLHTGLLGLFSNNGEILALDTLMRPVWDFHLGVSPTFPPWAKEGYLYYPISSNYIKTLNVTHYGKKPILSQTIAEQAHFLASQEQWEKAMLFADSSLNLEPGNSEALFLKAIYTENKSTSFSERERAWAKAIQLSSKNSKAQRKILPHYAKIIDAEYITPLPISQQTLYPQFFSYKKSLFTIDAAERQLVAFNAKNGSLRWSHPIGKIESAPVTSHHNNWLALGSGFSLNIINLESPTQSKTIDLPGKIFHIAFASDYIIASTWNGFLIKILLPSFQQAWSRKTSTEPSFTIFHKNNLISTTINGELHLLKPNSGLPTNQEMSLQTQITGVIPGDSAIAFTTFDGKILLYTSPTAPLLTLSPDQDVLFAQFIRLKNNQPCLLVSLANKELRLYSLPDGEIIWNYNGKHSVFGKFVVHNNTIWIDQKKHLIELSLENGKPIRKLSVAGNALSPFILDNMLYCATPQQLLFGFDLEKSNKTLKN